MSFRQWSDEFSSWVERISKRCSDWLHMCKSGTRTSSLPTFSKNIDWELKRSPSLTNRLTVGIAREIVDTSKTAGGAWYRLTDRFYGRNVQGATAIASQLQVLKRPTQIAESFHFLNVIRKLVREIARQSPKEPMPSAIVKAAYMRVVPETYRRAMETQVDVDKS